MRWYCHMCGFENLGLDIICCNPDSCNHRECIICTPGSDPYSGTQFSPEYSLSSGLKSQNNRRKVREQERETAWYCCQCELENKDVLTNCGNPNGCSHRKCGDCTHSNSDSQLTTQSWSEEFHRSGLTSQNNQQKVREQERKTAWYCCKCGLENKDVLTNCGNPNGCCHRKCDNCTSGIPELSPPDDLEKIPIRRSSQTAVSPDFSVAKFLAGTAALVAGVGPASTTSADPKPTRSKSLEPSTGSEYTAVTTAVKSGLSLSGLIHLLSGGSNSEGSFYDHDDGGDKDSLLKTVDTENSSATTVYNLKLLQASVPVPIERLLNSYVVFKECTKVSQPLTDLIKLSLERYTGVEWVWSPLSAPQRPGCTDIQFTSIDAKEVSQFRVPNDIAQQLKSYIESYNTGAESSGNHDTCTAAEQKGSAANAPAALKSYKTDEKKRRKWVIDPSTSSKQDPENKSGVRPGHILICLEGMKIKYSTVRTDSEMTDHEFMVLFRREFRCLRGFWAFWLSPWSFGWNNFGKFRRFNVRYLERLGLGLPHNDHSYEFEACQLSDGITKQRWRLYYFDKMACGRQCSLLRQLPKRKYPFVMDLHQQDEIMWGLDVKLQIWAIRVMFWQVGLLLGPTIFFIWWINSHPGEWPAATSIFMAMATILQIFFWMPLSGILQNKDN